MGFSFSNTFNRAKKFDIDTTGFGYKSLADLYAESGSDAIHALCGVYINTKGKFGNAPLFATTDSYINIPSHYCDVCEAILSNPEAIEAINAHKVGFTIYQYEARAYHRLCYGVRFVDVD